jgi:hypothetical protein
MLRVMLIDREHNYLQERIASQFVGHLVKRSVFLYHCVKIPATVQSWMSCMRSSLLQATKLLEKFLILKIIS